MAIKPSATPKYCIEFNCSPKNIFPKSMPPIIISTLTNALLTPKGIFLLIKPNPIYPKGDSIKMINKNLDCSVLAHAAAIVSVIKNADTVPHKRSNLVSILLII